MRRLWTFVLAVGSLLAFAGAHALPGPEIPDNVAQFWKRLGKAKTIAYTMKYWAYDAFGFMSDPQPGSRIFYVENMYEVTAQRPNRISISITPGIEREVIVGDMRQKQFNNYGDTLYVNNGKQSITCMAPLHIYRLGKGLDALAKDTNQPARDVQISWIFNENPMRGYRIVPEPLAGSSDSVIFILPNPDFPNSQQRIYFDRKTGYLTQKSQFDKDAKGTWEESRRQEFRFWDFDARLPGSTFSVRPPRMYITDDEYDRIYNIPSAPTVPK